MQSCYLPHHECHIQTKAESLVICCNLQRTVSLSEIKYTAYELSNGSLICHQRSYFKCKTRKVHSNMPLSQLSLEKGYPVSMIWWTGRQMKFWGPPGLKARSGLWWTGRRMKIRDHQDSCLTKFGFGSSPWGTAA